MGQSLKHGLTVSPLRKTLTCALGDLSFLCLFRCLLPVVRLWLQSCGLGNCCCLTSAIQKKTAELPGLRFPSQSNFPVNPRSEGPSLQPEIFFPCRDDRTWRVKAGPTRGPPSRDFLSTSPESCIEEVISTIGTRIAFLSFPPLFAERCPLQAGEEGSRQRLCDHPGGGEGAGFITGKGLFSRRPPNPFSPWMTERRGAGGGGRKIILLHSSLHPHRKFQIF